MRANVLGKSSFERSGSPVSGAVSCFSSHEAINAKMYQPFLNRGYTVFAVVHGSQPRFIIPEVVEDIRAEVCADKTNWLRLMESRNLTCEGFHCEMITERITPPQAPARFHNLFFHVPTGDPGVTPTFPPGRSEFDEFPRRPNRDPRDRPEDDSARVGKI